MKKLQIVLATAAILLLSGCQTLGIYTGDEYFYLDKGTPMSCREPAPYRGGNCKSILDWTKERFSTITIQ